MKRSHRTLILHCKKKSDRKAYERCALKNRAVIYVYSMQNPNKRDLDFTGIGRDKGDYYLMAYYLSLQSNLHDPKHQTRFIQPGDIDRTIAKAPDPVLFSKQVQALLDDSDLRFRNTPPKVENVDFSAYSLTDLIGRLEKTVYSELFEQCGNVLDTAQMLSGIPQSTLHAKK